MLEAIVTAMVKQCSAPENNKLIETKLVKPCLSWLSERFGAVFAIMQVLAVVILLQCGMITLLVARSFRT